MCDRSFTERKMLSPNMKSHKGDNSFECSQSDTPVANSGHEDQCETEHGSMYSRVSAVVLAVFLKLIELRISYFLDFKILL